MCICTHKRIQTHLCVRVCACVCVVVHCACHVWVFVFGLCVFFNNKRESVGERKGERKRGKTRARRFCPGKHTSSTNRLSIFQIDSLRESALSSSSHTCSTNVARACLVPEHVGDGLDCAVVTENIKLLHVSFTSSHQRITRHTENSGSLKVYHRQPQDLKKKRTLQGLGHLPLCNPFTKEEEILLSVFNKNSTLKRPTLTSVLPRHLSTQHPHKTF